MAVVVHLIKTIIGGIQELGTHRNSSNRPVLVLCMYKIPLNDFMINTKDRHVLRIPLAHIHIIEFQKRGRSATLSYTNYITWTR